MAYNGLYAKYSPVIKTFINNLVPGIDAFEKEEIHALTMGKAFLKLHQYRPTYPFGVWLKSIAKNNIRDFFRKSKTKAPFLVDQEIVDHINPLALLEVKEMKNSLKGFISSVKNEIHKKVINLRYDF